MYTIVLMIGALIFLSIFTYLIGRYEDEFNLDVFPCFCAAVLISAMWPIALGLTIAISPGVAFFYLGKRSWKIKVHKKKMWDTLNK